MITIREISNLEPYVEYLVVEEDKKLRDTFVGRKKELLDYLNRKLK